MRTLGIFVLFGFLVGCGGKALKSPEYQRFVLVPDPSQIKKDIPDGALALDTKTGQLCYTVGGFFVTNGTPRMDMCTEVYRLHPD
jgi:hypothetical protein